VATLPAGPALTRVRGVRIGHARDPELPSGVTTLVFDRPSPVAIDVRGGASGTFDTASLALDATFGRRSALFFSGGSLYGLDAARGIRVRLLEEGFGDRVFDNPNPIVRISGAILFDLPPRSGPIPDYLPLGYEAARTARSGRVMEGRVGAGAGARVAKYRGRDGARPGGVGWSAVRSRRDAWVGALAVANSVGAVRDPDSGRWLAVARDRSGRTRPPDPRRGRRLLASRSSGAAGTTLVAVVTDEALPRRALHRVALRAHDAIARLIWPAHTAAEGDVAFAVSTREATQPRDESERVDRWDRVAALAEAAVARALARAVLASARDGTARPA
jgi:L-aminopeptidase/D-esterase-like protein